MPKYSTVQAYSDNSSNVQTVSYEQATAAAGAKGPARPEKIVNPYGSTAGANSGDFHLYRQTRAREMERMKNLTQTEEDRQKDAEYQGAIDADRADEEARTDRKRKKRQKHKEAKLRKKMLAKAGVQLGGGADEEEEEVDEYAFVVPVVEDEEEGAATAVSAPTTTEENSSAATNPFPNDGSFLEMMKRKLAEEQAKGDKETI